MEPSKRICLLLNLVVETHVVFGPVIIGTLIWYVCGYFGSEAIARGGVCLEVVGATFIGYEFLATRSALGELSLADGFKQWFSRLSVVIQNAPPKVVGLSGMAAGQSIGSAHAFGLANVDRNRTIREQIDSLEANLQVAFSEIGQLRRMQKEGLRGVSKNVQRVDQKISEVQAHLKILLANATLGNKYRASYGFVFVVAGIVLANLSADSYHAWCWVFCSADTLCDAELHAA